VTFAFVVAGFAHGGFSAPTAPPRLRSRDIQTARRSIRLKPIASRSDQSNENSMSCCRYVFLVMVSAFWALPLKAVESPAAKPDDFLGVWTGEITAPNTKTAIGLAFTSTEKGMFVSLNFPEMFLYCANFGPAQIRGDTFDLAPLNLKLALHGETLVGTFAPAHLPVTLHRGGSFATEPPEAVQPGAPAPLWAHELGGSVWAGPTAFDGTVYIASVDGKVHAVRASDGAVVWTGPNPCYGAVLATAADLFLLDDRCDLVALQRADGVLKWRTPLYNEKLAGPSPPANETFNHRAATPVIDQKGNLYVGSADHGLYSVRSDTGRIVWRHDAKAPIHASVALEKDRVWVGAFDGSVLAVSLRSGQEISRFKVGGPIVSTPVLAAGRVVVGARDYLLYGLDAKSGAVAWRNSYWFSWVESTPRLADGVLYVGGSDFRRVSALDPATGQVKWSTDVGGLSWSTPLAAAETIFAGTCGQTMAGTVIKHTGGIVSLDRRTGAVRWRYNAPVKAGADFSGFVGSLVLIDGKIIGAGVDGTLIAFPSS